MNSNREIGEELALHLVVNALKLSPANPSFLDMRDAIFAELDNRLDAGLLSAGEHASARHGIWKAFGKFGMGVNARSNGASLFGIQEDSTIPADPAGPARTHVQIEATPALAIPDNNRNGVSNTLTIFQTGSIADLSVTVDIQHSYRGDLQVSLIPPVGNPIVLHNRTGGRTKDLVQAYTADTLDALAALVGQPVRGSWTLRIADLAPLDRGVLRRWSLDIDLAENPLTNGEAAQAGATSTHAPSATGGAGKAHQPSTAKKESEPARQPTRKQSDRKTTRSNNP